MRNNQVLDLAGCTEFRQALEARPPRLAHGTVCALVTLLAAALLWAALTKANLVVRAPGAVRPVTSAQSVKARFGGRVIQVGFANGQEVKQGDLLVQLDTHRLDNDIKRLEVTIQAGEDEQATLAALQDSLSHQFQADRATVTARLAQAAEEISKQRQTRDLSIQQAREKLATLEREEYRERKLAQARSSTPARLDEAMLRTQEARAELAKANLPVSDKQLEVLRAELVQLEATYRSRRQELRKQQVGKQGEVRAGRKQLDNLRWERDQAAVRSPIDGVVLSEACKVDDILGPGAEVAVLTVQKGYLFEAAVPSEEVGHVEEAMPARIKLDPFDYQKYGTLGGKVCFLSRDSRAGEPRGVYYTVKIELEGDEVGQGEHRGRVKLGMSGVAEIVTGQESILSLLVRKVRRTISLG